MIWTVLFAFLMFSLIIFVHELGHFVTARIFGVTVHEFAIGMGPKMFSTVKGETKYSLRLIPIGGFCSMEGEDEASEDEGAFSSKKWWKKLIILAAGAVMNVALGFVITTAFVGISTANTGVLSSSYVDEVMDNSPLYGFLQPGDKVIEVNGKNIHIKRDIDLAMMKSGGGECEIVIKRDGKLLTKKFVPMKMQYQDGSPAYMIGFTAAPKKNNVFGVLHEGYFQTVAMGSLVFESLGMLVGGKAQLTDMSGPVGVVDAMNTQAQSGGFVALLYLAGFISVNIGIMNLLPIPALDGGRIFFVIVEAIRRKPIPPEKEGVVHFIGLVLLMGLMVFATWNDIMRLILRN